MSSYHVLKGHNQKEREPNELNLSTVVFYCCCSCRSVLPSFITVGQKERSRKISPYLNKWLTLLVEYLSRNSPEFTGAIGMKPTALSSDFDGSLKRYGRANFPLMEGLMITGLMFSCAISASMNSALSFSTVVSLLLPYPVIQHSFLFAILYTYVKCCPFHQKEH